MWVTLLSRIGTDTRYIYPPFWSLKAIVEGSVDSLWETIGNIILFIPIGFCLKAITGWKRRYVIMAGLGISLLLELSQWFFFLGSTELDDVITNTIGVGIGAHLFRSNRRISINRNDFFISVVAFVLLLISPFVFQHIRTVQMTKMAALNDRDDGTKNLLVLNGKPGIVGKSEVYVSYNSDGSIIINGYSDDIDYKIIGRLDLEAGNYTFSGFSGVEPNTVSIYLEKHDSENPNADSTGYVRFTPDLGPLESINFTLIETERVRACVKVYPESNGKYIARPVIYKEE